jgi:hypothetical protein
MEISATGGLMLECATHVRRAWRLACGICVAGALLLIVLAPDRVTAAGSGKAIDRPDAVTPIIPQQSTGSTRPVAQAGELRGDWSLPIDGLRGRLIATTVEDNGRPQVRLELELENVRDAATPIAIW